MRSAFLSVALAGAAVLSPPSEAVAADRDSPKAKSVPVRVSGGVQKVSHVPVNPCPEEKREGRVRSDIIFEMTTGEIISSALYDPKTGDLIKSNLTDDDLKKTQIRPASLTKLESAMAFMRQITSGLMPKDSVFRFFFKKKQPTDMTTTDIVVASLNPSANLFDHPKIATPDFIANMNAYMKANGRTGTTYMNLTGYPTSPEVRKQHVSTLHDQILSIRDFEINYVPKAKDVFGVDKISGLWTFNVPGIKGTHHTISILENATGEKAHPIPGVVDGKSGTTCNFGSGAYIKYIYNKATFGILSIGHETGELRDAHLKALIEKQKPSLEAFTRKAIPQPPALSAPVPTETDVVPVPAPEAASGAVAGLSFEHE